MSFGIVENDADSMAMAGAQLADAVPEIDAIRSARALHRSVMHREYHRVALPERHHCGA